MILETRAFKLIHSCLLFAFFATSALPAATVKPPPVFAIQERWNIGGEGSWDRLTIDPVYRRLYVTRGNRVTVVDIDTGKAFGEILGLTNVRSICLDADGKYGYIADGGSDAVRVFDRATLNVVASLAVGANPDAAVFDTFSGFVFVFNTRSRTATVIDAASNVVAGSIALPGKPAGAAADGKGSLFVALEDAGQLARIDTKARTVTDGWPVEGCVGPNGLAIDKQEQRIYTACENNEIAVLDSSTGKLLTTAKLGGGARELVFDPRRNLILAANPGGSLTVLRADSSGHLVILQTLKTQAGARTLALDAATGRIYLAAARFGLRTGETSEELLYRPTPIPGSFAVLVLGE
jgi:YVTN family beta-propeller protein